MTTTTFSTPPLSLQSLRPTAVHQRSAGQWLPSHARSAVKAVVSFLFRPDTEASRAFYKHEEFRRDQQALIQSGIHFL